MTDFYIFHEFLLFYYVPIMISHLLIGCEKKKVGISRLIVFAKTKMKKKLIILFYNHKGTF